MDLDSVILIGLKLFSVFFLVFLNGFFVATEFALVKIRDTQLQPLINKGNRRAKVAHLLVERLDASLSATQLGITLASLGLGWVGEPVFHQLLHPVMDWLRIESQQVQQTLSFGIGFSAITFLHIVVGELAPKSLAIQRALPTTLWVAVPLWWFYKISFPFIWLLNHTSLWILRQVGIEPVSEAEMTHSEEEMRLLFAAAPKGVGVTTLGRQIVLNALDLRRRVAREVMRPRQEIVALSTEQNLAECLDLAEKTRFSRFPLCKEGNLDEMIGVVHFKDMFALRFRARNASDLVAVARKVIYVPETARLEKLLQLLMDRKLHMAIVVDEYGGTVGMVTLENILEELVGQIQDEFDQELPMQVKLSEQEWDLMGGLPLHDLAELTGEPIEEEGITTASGWVTHKLGGFPKVGDVIKIGSYEVRVEEMEGLRVARLKLRKLEDAPMGHED
jgi:CBS domain containing-hemolysin-like protein